jgi:TfoX/Sxy family transcriptional regulator of competence genes
MATSVEYIEYVCEQVRGIGDIRYKKMFGEYMVYVNDKPILLVCDSTVYVKRLDCISEQMSDAETGFPYQGAKLHYILDIENRELCQEVILALEEVTSIPKPRKKKAKNPPNLS